MRQLVVIAAGCAAGLWGPWPSVHAETADQAHTAPDSSRRAVGAAADNDDDDDNDDDRRWSIEEVRVRMSTFVQQGRGYQSKAVDTPSGPGDESTIIYQPIAAFRIRQNDRVQHTVVIPVDIVSAASPDALDAVSSASRVNEAASIDVTTTYEINNDLRASANYGVHVEEPYRSWQLGGALSADLADDNATLTVSINGLFDMFDHLTPTGVELKQSVRGALNANIGISQLLSPTTIGFASYGITHQRGTLEHTWNSIAIGSGIDRIGEVFPGARTRHATRIGVAQHIPGTDSTLRSNYRYYRDDFGVAAHTADATWYQYLGDRHLVAGHYRYHDQDAVRFYTESVPMMLADDVPRTADSDLSAFRAHTAGLKWTFSLAPLRRSWTKQSTSFDIAALRYWRSNGMSINVVSLGYAQTF